MRKHSYSQYTCGHLYTLDHFISHLSQKMTQLLGSNPIAVLATLFFLLSHAKVLRAIIAALYVTYLHAVSWQCEHCCMVIGWNIEYLTGKYIPLFVIALLVLVIVFLPYTLFLFLDQWIQVLQDKVNWRIFSWLSKPRIRAFLDAYYAPYSANHRHWTGQLLLVRCVLFLIFATAGNTSANLLNICSVTTGLLSLSLLTGGIYKSWYHGALETSFLLNLAILTAATYHIKVSGGNQAALIFFFLSIVFITSTGIVLFHIYSRARNTSMWKRCAKPSSNDVHTPLTADQYNTEKEKPVTSRNYQSITISSELWEPMLDEN